MLKVRMRYLWGLAAGAVALALALQPARAVPSFASQTGQPCTACHAGAFGPQLTPFGRAFKMTGYTLSGGEGLASRIPLSGMVQTSFTNTAQGQPGGAAPHFGDNNNFAMDQVSLFLAGRVNDYAGGFIQATYSSVDQTFLWDNTDLRLTTPINLPNDANLRLGFSLNNGPTVQDPYNTTYAWGYPFISSSLAPTPTAGPIIASLIGNSIGTTVSAWYDNALYVEAGVYNTMSTPLSKMLGQFGGPGSSTAPMPYARIAYEWDWAGQAAEIGGLLFHASLEPGGTPGFGSDTYTDFAVDGTYQLIGDGTNVVTVNGIYTHEIQHLSSSVAQGIAANANGYLDFINANVSYYYQHTYGVTFGVQSTTGSADALLYAPGPVGGSLTGSPNSMAFITELDWVPFGKSDSVGAPFANLKFGLQYTAYTEFNGGTSNYDGFGRSASANNTLYAFAWLAF
ncbi:MAG: hypothetical protein M0Z28_04775 [Rhodospirillales bacterium]|nr:hypothetical protein [Rhodospirillales bacterium]